MDYMLQTEGIAGNFGDVYLDDLIIYSPDMESHKKHLRRVLEVLRKWKYYAKFKKCEFAQTKVHYLGRIIEDGTIRVDPKKVEAISKWQQPQNITELRGFLGTVGWL